MKTKINTIAGEGSLDPSVRDIIPDTPETDAHIKACLWSGGRNGNAYELCRKLERDRDQWQRIAQGFAPFVEPHVWAESSVQDTMDEYEAIISANVRDDLLGTDGTSGAAKPSTQSDSGGELGRSLR